MELSDFANSPIPEALMVAAGALAAYIAASYLKDRESQRYKGLALLGMIGGAVLLAVGYAVFQASTLPIFSLVLLLLTGFALFFRPLQKIPVAAVFGLIVGVFVYLYLGGITDPTWEMITMGTGRIVVAAVAAMLVFTALNFIEQLLDFASTVLNAWPILLILGVLCFLDGLVLIGTGDSLLAMLQASTGR